MVCIYLRVSTDSQQTGMEAQERAVLSYCQSQNIGNFKVFRDSGVSGTRLQRPGLDALLAEINSGTVTSVIVYSFSRFARSVKQLLTALELFESKNVSFISVSEQFDTNTSTGKFVFTILAALSQMERSIIVERVKNGLINARAKGRCLGRPRTRNGQAIRQLLAQGFSQRQTAKLLGCSRNTVQREQKDVATNPKTEVIKAVQEEAT